jgi:hypothetical protein
MPYDPDALLTARIRLALKKMETLKKSAASVYNTESLAISKK